jgi:hypothetical protein
MVATLIDKFHFPTSVFINDFNNDIGGVANLIQAQTALGVFSRTIGMINVLSIDKLREFVVKIREEQAKLFNVAQQLAPNPLGLPLVPQPINQQGNPILNAQDLYDQNRRANENYIRQQINNFRTGEYIDRMVADQTQIIDGQPAYNNRFVNGPPTIDGNAYNGLNDNGDNTIYEVIKLVNGKQQNVFRLRNGQEINRNQNFYTQHAYNALTGQWDEINGGQQLNILHYLRKATLNLATNNVVLKSRYLREQLAHFVRTQELPIVLDKLRNDQNYDPLHNQQSMIYPNRNDANQIIGGFGFKKKKGKNKKYDSDNGENSDSDKEINNMGSGFIKRKIKIGKGIEINKDEPRFRAFGKYIINMPQLHNNNILNFKHKSGGTIPSIKPVNIDENFKDFILDVLNSGRVNDRHFDSLTEPEKNHFIKVVRGAGIMEHLKLKQSNHDFEKKELDRLELLLG